MSSLAIHRDTTTVPVVKPEPRSPISIRAAVASDLKFIDGLQKLHTKMVGWMPTKQLETYVQRGHVLIAEEGNGQSAIGNRSEMAAASPIAHCPLLIASPLGYCISRDQYFKRDDVGIIYQLNVLPAKQRGLIGAALIKAVFERAAYGCKLFCCWCAQDIEANHFWESLGFIPLAFRAGSRNKQPIHIFWQRRVREGDSETPYWFPSQTTGGAIREDRLVIPMPPGTHWSDAKPIVLPGQDRIEEAKALAGEGDTPKQRKPRARQPKPKAAGPIVPRRSFGNGGLRFVLPGESTPDPRNPRNPRNPKSRPPKQKNDPKYVAAARELRDRYLEQVNTERMLPGAQGKYDVSRQLEAAPSELKQTPLLKAA